jgi:hypothetical protein
MPSTLDKLRDLCRRRRNIKPHTRRAILRAAMRSKRLKKNGGARPSRKDRHAQLSSALSANGPLSDDRPQSFTPSSARATFLRPLRPTFAPPPSAEPPPTP